MKTKIAKEFKWEMSHRLPYHEGPCKNIHGHSYKMVIFLEGEPNHEGMVIDFYDIETAMRPLLNKLDHAFLCSNDDDKMISFLEENQYKYVVMPYYTTAENMVTFFMDEVIAYFKKFDNIETMGIRVYETEDAYAERFVNLK